MAGKPGRHVAQACAHFIAAGAGIAACGLLAADVVVAAEAVGRIAGDVAVTATGGATYTVPLPVAAGMNGMRPALALAYHSQSGEGLAGTGWTLAGLPEIARCPLTRAVDGRVQGVRYGAEDRYCLDGHPLLLLSGTPGADGAEYRAEVHRYERIVARGRQGTGPAWFELFLPDGTAQRFGNDEDSRIEAPGTGEVRAWALNEVEDRHRQRMGVRYAEDTATGEYAPAEVRWTWGPGESFAQARYRVLVDLEARPAGDVREGFTWGSPWRASRRLSAVRYEYNDGAGFRPVQRFDLRYAPVAGVAVAREELASITQCGPTDCLPPTVVAWDAHPEGRRVTTLAAIPFDRTVFGDVNGDGATDAFGNSGGRWVVWPANPQTGGFYAPVPVGGTFTSTSVGLPTDYNGDGLTDLLVGSSQGPNWLVYQAPASLGQPFTVRNTGIAWSDGAEVATLDVDGDGLDDVVYLRDAQLRIRRNVGGVLGVEVSGGITPVAGPGSALAGRRGHVEAADFDGDGRRDALVVRSQPDGTQYRWEAFLSRGLGFDPEPIATFTTSLSYSDVVVLDVNGDGLTDILHRERTGTSWRLLVSRGRGTGAEPALVEQSCPAPLPFVNGYPLTALDVDGDGRSEVLTRGPSGWRLHRATANCYGAQDYDAFTGPSVIDHVRLLPADVDADGTPDILFGSRNLARWAVSRPAKALRADGTTPVLRGGLVREITDGLGNVHEFRYRSLTGWDGYRAPGGALAETRLLRGGPVAVVSAWGGTTGRGEERFTVALGYEDARLGTTGRGFLGFARVTATDSRNGQVTDTHYRQDFPFAGQVERVTVSAAGRTVAVHDPAWSAVPSVVPDAAGDAWFVHLATERTDDYEVDAAGGLAGSLVRTRQRTLTWNLRHGAVSTEETVVTSPLDAGRSYRTTRTVTFDDALAAAPGCLGLPARVDVTRDVTGTPPLTRTTRSSYDAATCSVLSRVEGPTATPIAQLVTTFTYDAAGRTTAITRADGAGALQPRTTRLRYDTSPFRPSAELQVISGEQDYATTHGWDDGLGVEVSRTAPNGTTTLWEHDDFGRRLVERRPTGSSNYEQAACGPCFAPHARYRLRETRSDGFWTETQHDALGRVVGRAFVLLDGRASRQMVEHDALGRVVRESVPGTEDDAGAWWTRRSWDVRDRPVSVEEPVAAGDAPAVTTITYAGLERTVRDAEGRSTTYASDADGRLVRVTAPLGGGASYAWDAFGSLSAITDAAGHARSFTYDTEGRPTRSTDPDAGTREYGYNAFGELTTLLDGRTPAGVVILSYDQLGRPTQRVEPEGTTSWSWNATPGGSRGQLREVTGPLGTSATGFRETYAYGPSGRLRQVTTAIEGTSYVTDYAYDAEGNLTSMVYPATVGWRPTFRLGYAHGHLAWIAQENAATSVLYSALAMDAQGRDVRARLGNDVLEEASEFDPATGRLAALRTGQVSGAADIQDYAYDWDRVGNLVSRSDRAAGRTETFSYDDLGRLTAAALGGVQTLAVTYTPDGNIAGKSDAGQYTYGAAGRLPHAVTAVTGGPRAASGITYDANGNMTAGFGRTLSWMSYNLPREITRGADYARFGYGPGRERVTQQSRTNGVQRTTHYVGPHFEVEIEGTSRRYRSNVFAYGRAVYSQVELSGGGIEAYYLLHDHQGSVDRLVRAAGTGPDRRRQDFDAWGKRRNTDWSADPTDARAGDAHFTERGYTGHEHLDGVRLIHMNGRLEDPALGRMLSPDPMLGNIASPQGLNPYSYVANGPASLVDPSGFFLGRIGKFFKRAFRHIGSFGRRLVRRWGRQIAAVAAGWFAGGFASGWAQGMQLGDIGVSIGAGGLAAEGVGTVATLTASVPAATVVGGIVGGAVAGGISAGNLSGAGMGALSGGVTAGIGGYYGGGYGAGRVLAEAAVGGATSELSGGDFARGALVSGGLSSLTWASLEMRRVMIEQSRLNPANATGISAGFRSDMFKLGGSRKPSKWSPLGGRQGGAGNVFGIDYGPGSFLDGLVEAYSGPHDFLNSPFFYNDLGNNAGRLGALELVNAANVLVATPFVGASVVPGYTYGALGD